MILTILVLILIISVLVLVHELGHFAAARKVGVKVEEFGFGLPPKLFGKKIGETIYSINLLPFGGFVKLMGEEGESSDPRSFFTKKPSQRSFVLVAGVFMNLILALSLYYAFFLINNFKSFSIPLFFDYDFRFGQKAYTNTVVTDFTKDSAAERFGIKRGEAILEIDNIPVYSVNDVRAGLLDKGGTKVKLLLTDVKKVKRDIRILEVVPDFDENKKGFLGVLLTKTVLLDYSGNKILSGIFHTYNMASYSFSTFGNLIELSLETKNIRPVSESVSGPVGIFNITGIILGYQGKEALLGLVDLTALLSLSLAFLNILPFPALDGGRLLFVIIEVIRKKKLSKASEDAIHKWGMALLFALIILVTFKDVMNLRG